MTWNLIYGKLRRFYLVHFRQDYVERQMKKRMGTCRQCGTCCTFLLECPVLNTRRRNCILYSMPRPKVCKIFPIDERDIQEVSWLGKSCGFYFK
ncbi:MAG: hypothetical protein HQK77_12425 [Desulfobacterales bacterium]|nr:hypothetical protein [Desulfobacterales bacterium]